MAHETLCVAFPCKDTQLFGLVVVWKPPLHEPGQRLPLLGSCQGVLASQKIWWEQAFTDFPREASENPREGPREAERPEEACG